jgi:hypothetical protein
MTCFSSNVGCLLQVQAQLYRRASTALEALFYL